MVRKLKSSSATWVTQWEVESSSRPGIKYKVSQKSDGSFACDCPKWKFAKAPKPDCHHVIEVKQTERGPNGERIPVVYGASRTYSPEQRAVLDGAIASERARGSINDLIRSKQASSPASNPEPVFLLQTKRRILLP